MLEYLHRYESISDGRMRIFNSILGWNLVLLKVLLIFVKLAILSSSLKSAVF